jgi:hypothetical protein
LSSVLLPDEEGFRIFMLESPGYDGGIERNGTPPGLLKLYPDQSELQLEDIKLSVAFAGFDNDFLYLTIRLAGKIGFLFLEENRG